MDNNNEIIKSLKGKWAATRLKVSYKNKVLNDNQIISHNDAYAMVISCWDKELINVQEQLMAFYLTRKNKLIGYRLICTGTSSNCLIDIKFIVSLALHTMATSVIIAHNHPSGELIPSSQDKHVTLHIREALELINVRLYDHIIISDRGFYSFTYEGEM